MAFALHSLVEILEQDQHRHHLSRDLRSKIKYSKIESLLIEACSLRDLVESTSFAIIEDFESRIRDVAHDAEDIIECHIVVQLAPVSEEEEAYELELRDVMEEFVSIKVEIMRKIMDSIKAYAGLPPMQSSPVFSLSQVRYCRLRVSSQKHHPSSRNAVVGFEKDFKLLMRQLRQGRRELQVIPIVGIAGSGKTTLAQSLYNHLYNTEKFDIFAWTTISQSCNLRYALLALLGCQITINDQLCRQTDVVFRESVYKIFMGRRYLIVVDDVWNINDWNRLRWFFPDHHNGSRIIVTTRMWNVAEYVKTSINPHQMLPIDDNSSWKLLYQKVFGDERCPPTLVEIGRKIARNCRGNPLAIVTMAGFLSASKKTLDVWQRAEFHQLDSTDVREEVDLINEEMSKKVDPSLRGFVEFFAKDGLQLMNQLIQGKSELQIIPMVGMGGSGKTTLARLLYSRALHAKHFDTHAWVTVKEIETVGKKQRNVLATLQDLLDSLHKCGMPQVNDDDIGVRLHKTLKNRRYLIVVDDIREAHTWDTMRRFFPNEGNGSRIILTARKWSHYDGINPFHLDSYWEFVLGKAFEQEHCPPKLEKTGMKVAGLLPTPEKILEFWKLVEIHVSSPERNHDLNLDLLSMTYNHLPYHLKPCFLYMGAFPEDYEIRVSNLIQLWIAEGFVRVSYHSEDTAETYLEALMDRNLLFACKKDCNGKVKTIKVHDVFWKFCRKKAYEEKFLWFKDLNGQDIPEEEIVRRVSLHPSSQPPSDDEIKLMTPARSFLCIGRGSLDIAPVFLVFRLLRVLDVLQLQFDQFPEEILKLVNLRYMALTCHSALPSSISILRNLQTLITSMVLSLPSELWEISRLRHIKCKETFIWNFPGNGEFSWKWRDLQTLMNIPASEVTDEFLRFNPELRKLGIYFNASPHTFLHLDRLNKLEVLKCFSVLSKTRRDFLPYLGLPTSLRKLSLSLCIIPSTFIRTIGMLPSLQHLKLQKCDFVNLEWILGDGDFHELASLVMEDLNLVNWDADSKHFPNLQHLIIRGCHSLKEIPFDIGEITTLELVEVNECSRSLMDSTRMMHEKLMEMGYYYLRVVLNDEADGSLFVQYQWKPFDALCSTFAVVLGRLAGLCSRH